jgi:adenosyl cobinamide kinase/adenosyl cobinamide phosphate guanylyltransferase
MSEESKAVFVDCLTGEVTERLLTAEEIADQQIQAQAQADREAEAQAKADARLSALAKLADLGLTQDEINAL